MSTKRGTRTANGRSSIFQDANGEWHGFVTVGTKPDGTPDRRHVRSVRGEAAVTAKVRKLEQSRDAGTIVQAGQQWTVASWVEHVITNVLGSKLAPNTARSYRGHVDKHIKPALGRIRLQDLRVDQVERMFGDIAEVPDRDRVDDHAWPLTAAEAQKLLRHTAERPDAARWSLALLGLRPGEVLGLDWSSIDLDGGWLEVRQQLIEVYPYRHGCMRDDAECRKQKGRACPRRVGGRMLTRVKSKAGRRRIKLPSLVVAQLRDVRKQWMESRIKAGEMRQERWGDLVFAQSIGAPMDASKDRKAWADVLAAVRIEGRRLYDARHSTATLLLEEGGDLQQVKDLLGHSQIAVSSRYYVHATDRLAIDTANRLGAALFGTDAGSSSGSSSG